MWLARLRSDEREARVEADFRAWLDAAPEHRAAFEAVNDAWDVAGGVDRAPAPTEPRRASGVRASALAAVAAAVVAVVAWQWNAAPTVATEVGERRTLALADGSTVTLNTDTKLRTRFADDRRLVLLDEGEASFEVAKDTLRPFVVEAGDARVVAVGTVFDVRWVDGRLAVTLAEGKVRVVEDEGRGSGEFEMRPGQRFEQAAPAAAPKLVAVDLAAARAWRAGQVVFDETPLAQAVAEMNRYSERKLELEGAVLGDLTVSGAFRAGGTAEFARALADLYGLDVSADGDGLRLRAAPARAG